jgi:4'-phosphopantetheinyl transferase
MQLSANHIHVWIMKLDVAADRLAYFRTILAADELERADRFYFERDRLRFAAGRGILREILGQYLGALPARLAFAYNEYGKPSLAGDYMSALSFNLSHSGATGLLAVRRGGDLGVDIEEYLPGKGDEAVAEQYFSPREVGCFRSVPRLLRTRAFLNCWTRKEAYIKARGMGLSIPLDSFDVSLIPGEPATLLRTAEADDLKKWRLQALELGGAYIGAIAASGRAWTVILDHWGEASMEPSNSRSHLSESRRAAAAYLEEKGQ